MPIETHDAKDNEKSHFPNSFDVAFGRKVVDVFLVSCLFVHSG